MRAFSGFGTYGTNNEGSAVHPTTLHPIRACLLLRLGRADLAEAVWAAGTGRPREADPARPRPKVDLTNYGVSYLTLAVDLAWFHFDRAVCAHMRGDDAIALADARVLTSLQKAVETRAEELGFPRPERHDGKDQPTPYIDFLGQLPDRLCRWQRPSPDGSSAIRGKRADHVGLRGVLEIRRPLGGPDLSVLVVHAEVDHRHPGKRIMPGHRPAPDVGPGLDDQEDLGVGGVDEGEQGPVDDVGPLPFGLEAVDGLGEQADLGEVGRVVERRLELAGQGSHLTEPFVRGGRRLGGVGDRAGPAWPAVTDQIDLVANLGRQRGCRERDELVVLEGAPFDLYR